MATTTEELQINITVNSAEAERKLEALRSRITQIAALSQQGNFQHLGELAKSIKSMASSADKLSGVAQSLKAITEHASAFGHSLAGIKDTKDAFNGMSKSIKNAQAALEGAESAGSKGKGLFGSLGSMDISGVTGSVVSDFKRIWNAGSKVAQIPFKMLFAPMQGLATRVAGLAQGFSHLFHTIGRVAFMRAIRAAIRMVTQALKEGVKAVYDWAGAVGNGFVNTMNSIVTSLTYFRNSIGAAISPILDAIAPVLDAVIDKCVAVINVFNQLIATLTGASTWRKAEKVATSFGGATNNAAKGANNANKAAKELKRTLLGFDEINRLDAPDSGSGSGGSGGGGGGGSSGAGALTFSNQPISDAVENFADMLRKAWDKGDFTSVGNLIGEKIGKALLKVPWEKKIQPTASKIATSFGTLLTGMFDYGGSGGKAMWDGIAYTIYGAINTALIARSSFFESVNWTGIGRGIGAALAKVVYNIRWDEVRKNLSAFPNAVIQAVTGFCMQMSPADFHQAGIKIGNAVAGAIIDIKWSDFFQNAFKMADRLVLAINGVFEAFGSKWGEIKTGIINGIKSVPAEQWAKLGTDIGHMIFNVASFVGNMVDLLVKAVEAGHWGRLIGSIWQGINDKVSAVYGGWGGAAIALGKWIVSHIGVISIVLSFAIGHFLITSGVTIVKNMLKDAISGKLGGATGGIVSKGWKSGALGLAATASLLFEIGMLDSDVKAKNWQAFAKRLAGGLVGGFIGFLAGGWTGAAFGFTIGAELTINFTKIVPNIVKGADKLLFGWYDKLFGGKDAETDYTGEGLSDDYYSYLDNLNGGGKNNNTVTSKQNRTYGAANTANTNPSVQTGSMTVQMQGEVTSLSFKNLAQKFYQIMGMTGWMQTVADKVKPGDKQTKGFTAWYEKMFGKGVKGTTITDFIAEYIKRTGKNNALTGSKITGFVAEFIKRIQKKGVNIFSGNTISNFVAEFIKRTQKKGVNVFSGSTISGFIAQIVDRVVKWKNPLDQFIEFIAKITKKTTSKDGIGATGGIYKNGRWQPVQRYASGGLIGTSGQMFIAREAGPELVGTLGGNTAIMNNDQIVSSVSNGVAKAVSQVLGGQGNNPIEVVVKVDSEVLYRSVQKGERKANGRYGTVVALG